MLRPRRFDTEIDPGPVQIQARKVHFDLSDIPLEWIPGHPVASTMINLFNVVLPPAEHWFVKTFNEALPLVKDPRLADEMRGFIGQEATHAAAHDEVIRLGGRLLKAADDRTAVRGVQTYADPAGHPFCVCWLPAD